MTQIVRKPRLSKEKSKWVKNREVYLQGLPLNHSAALRVKYEKELRTLVMRMATETQKEIVNLFRSETADDFFESQKTLATMDASISSSAKKLLNKLYMKFYDLFSAKSSTLALSMVKQADKNSRLSLKSSLNKMTGLTLKTDFIPAGVKEIAKSSISENVSLIKSIPEKYFTDVTGAVMRSITSGLGIKELIPQIKKYEGITDRRAKNIALDQTRKAYNSINKQRMMAAGFKKFKWLHSAGGQKPRKDHIAMSGNIYSFDDLPVIDKKTGERGIPGQLVNCKCVLQPVYEFQNGEVA